MNPSNSLKTHKDALGVSSRLPLPRSAIKRVSSTGTEEINNRGQIQNNTGNAMLLTPTPSNRIPYHHAGSMRLPSTASPNKFRKPDESLLTPGLSITNPRFTTRRISTINPQSPLATPPQRCETGKKSTRLSIYGVPLSLAEHSTSKTALSKSLQLVNSEMGSSRIAVCVRKRPLSATEFRKGAQNCVSITSAEKRVQLSVPRLKLDGIEKYTEEYHFNFDFAYDEHVTNEHIYKEIVHPLVEFVRAGGRATCFAYGQTGSGKTHTMFHPQSGQCYLAIRDLIYWTRQKGLVCGISFFEIYQSHLYDLLRDRKKVIPCERRDGSVTIMGLAEDEASTEMVAEEVMTRGLQARMTGKTGANTQSSRGHAVLQFTIRGHENVSPSEKQSKSDRIYSQLSFIDLAGSERGADRAEVDRRTKLEGSEINKSLLALKECIRAIDQDASHLPFRQSKLTLVLKDSIIGDVRTAMIATVSPASTSSEHSLNTLRYAERFHEISNNNNNNNDTSREDYGTPRSVISTEKENLKTDWQVSSISNIYGGEFKLSGNLMEKTIAATNTTTTNANANQTFHTTPSSKLLKRNISTGSETLLLREKIRLMLNSIQEKIDGCQDADILELLMEELFTVSHAFESLSQSYQLNSKGK